jgi:hydroxymethylpyrimidine pyrophosphatase-like HAD family hydrolase
MTEHRPERAEGAAASSVGGAAGGVARSDCRYDLLAVDLDGTLLDSDGHVSPANARALARARRAGMIVTICTGRALVESRAALAAVAQIDPVIVSGGAMVACPATGRTLERLTLEGGLVERAVGELHAAGHAAIILKDPHAAGYDYLVIAPDGRDDDGALDPASRWWFRRMGASVRYAPRLEDDPHPEHSVRVGAASANEPVDALAARLRERFEPHASLQHFRGATLPRDRLEEGIHSVHIVEIFHARADKWQAVQRLAARLGVGPRRICAIGDQLNDLSMIARAGLGIAMGNAAPEVARAAGRQTLDNNHDGVAHAVDRLLSGEW